MNCKNPELGHFSRSNQYCNFALSRYLGCMKHYNEWTAKIRNWVISQGQISTVTLHCPDILAVINITMNELQKSGTGSFLKVKSVKSRYLCMKHYNEWTAKIWVISQGQISTVTLHCPDILTVLKHYNEWTAKIRNWVISQGQISKLCIMSTWLYETLQWICKNPELGHFSRSNQYCNFALSRYLGSVWNITMNELQKSGTGSFLKVKSVL